MPNILSPVPLRWGMCLFLVMEAAIVATAAPLSVYLQEGFNGAALPPGWTVTQVSGYTATWTVVGTGTNPPIPPYEGSGQAEFNSYDATEGDQARLITRRVDLSTSGDPFLSFFMYHDDEYLTSLDSIYVEGTAGDSVTGPWMTLVGYCRPSPAPGWRREAVALIPFVGSGRVFISFRGVSQYGNNMYLDAVTIADSSFHDIGAASLISPGQHPDQGSPFDGSRRAHSWKASSSLLIVRGQAALPLDIGAVVMNYGTFAEPTYQVQWQIDSQSQAPVNNSHPLTRGGRDTLSLQWLMPAPGTHGLTAWTVLGTDSNSSNDTARLTIVVLDSAVMFSEMFDDTLFPPAGWTAVNRDGGPLLPWFRAVSTAIFLPYEGTGFAADNFQRANGTYIDDYLISPPIPGVAQNGRDDSLRFWVRSAFNPPPEQNYPDSLMVLISTTGADTSNFTTQLDYFSVPKTGWTLKTYPLLGRVPNGSTVRIAFRYLLYDGGPTGNNSDFIGIDFVHVKRGGPTDVSLETPPQRVFSLGQNYPNPFNPTTEIDFTVREPGKALLTLYDILGRRVATLFEGRAEPSITYRVRLDASHLSSGVYFYLLQEGSMQGAAISSTTRRMLLVR